MSRKEDMFVLTASPEKAPDQAQYVEIEFRTGNTRRRGRQIVWILLHWFSA